MPELQPASEMQASMGPEQIFVSDVTRDLGVEQGFSFDYAGPKC